MQQRQQVNDDEDWHDNLVNVREIIGEGDLYADSLDWVDQSAVGCVDSQLNIRNGQFWLR